MACVPGRESLALEYVTEVTAAANALDLDPLSVRVGQTTNRSRNLLVERGPAAVGVELVLGPVEGCPTLLAFVGPGSGIALVLSRERGLGSLVKDHSLLGSRQRSESRSDFGHGPSNGRPY